MMRRRTLKPPLDADAGWLERGDFLLYHAHRHRPGNLRQLFRAALSEGVSGVEETEAGFAIVRAQVSELRRAGLLSGLRCDREAA